MNKSLRRIAQAGIAVVVGLTIILVYLLWSFVQWLSQPLRALHNAPSQQIVILIVCLLFIATCVVGELFLFLAINNLGAKGISKGSKKWLSRSSTVFFVVPAEIMALWCFLKVTNPSGNNLIVLSGLGGTVLAVIMLSAAAGLKLLAIKAGDSIDFQADSELTI